MKPQGKPCNAATYRQATFDLAKSVPHAVVVEVGVYAGALSMMLHKLPGLKEQYIVDNWHGSYTNFGQAHMDKIAAEVMDWAKHAGVHVDRMKSSDAAPTFEDNYIDFFHTDGDHSYARIHEDITLWEPKVKPGGIISGDNFEIPEVARAVRELLPTYKLLANGRLWYCRKP